MNPVTRGFPVPTQIAIFTNHQSNASVTGTYVAPETGTYLVSGCGGGGAGSAGGTLGGAGAQIYRMPVYLYAGEELQLTIGSGGFGSAGGATIIGDFVTLGGGASAATTPGTITMGSRICTPVNLASGAGPGFAFDLSEWPRVSQGTPGTASVPTGIGYGVGSKSNVWNAGFGLVVIERLQ